jgi:hypothetical protein
MNDREIDALVRQAQTHADAEVAAFDLGRGEQELLEEIMSAPFASHRGPSNAEPVEPGEPKPVELPLELPPAERPAPFQRRRRVLIGVAAAVAFAAAIAGPTIAFRGGDDVKVVPGNETPAGSSDKSRVLLDDPAWKITHVDEDTPINGEIQFSNGKLQLEVRWVEADSYKDLYADRMDVSKPEPFPLFGAEGAQFTYGPTDFAVILPPQGKTALEIRGGVGDKAAFAALTTKLRQVSVEQWEAAMPASVVTPDRAAERAKQMLADVPLPAGYDAAQVPTSGTNDEYQYGAAVIGNVTCVWLKEYQSARKASDEAGMATVDKALKTSRSWKTLQSMNAEGDYPEVVWEFADLVAQRKAVDDYPMSLGCE